MKRKLTQKYVGTKAFPSTIDITDPCYSKDVWCRLNNVSIKPGEYSCYAWMKAGDCGSYCAIAGIYLNNNVQETTELIGDIGVDAGLAGFFADKPDYNDKEWHDFCNRVRKGDAWILDEGFCTSSGWGDGEYDVYAARNENGEIVALEIRFL
jgi:hypothetical protein